MSIPKFLNLAWMTVAAAPGTGDVTVGMPVTVKTAAGRRVFLSFAAAGVQNGEGVCVHLMQDGESEIFRGIYADGVISRGPVVINSHGTQTRISFGAGATIACVASAEDLAPLRYFSIEEDVPDDGGKSLVFSLNETYPLPPTSQRTAWRFAADGTPSRMLLDDWGSHIALTFRRAQGTAAAPSAMVEGQSFGLVSCEGYGETGYVVGYRAKMDFFASENWSDTVQGCEVAFFNTENGTSTPKERLRIKHDGKVGIGTDQPKAKLGVSENAAAGPDALSGSSVQVVGADNTAARAEMVAAGSSAQVAFRRAGGTMAEPTQTPANQIIGSLAAFGHDGDDWTTSGRVNVQLLTAEAWSPTAQGTKYRVQVTPIGTTATFTALSVLPDGSLGMGPAETVVITKDRHPVLPPYTVAQVAALDASPAGQQIFVTNEAGGPVPAFSDGANWRRCTDRAIVS